MGATQRTESTVSAKLSTLIGFFNTACMYACWRRNANFAVYPPRQDDDGYLIALVAKDEQQLFAVHRSRHAQIENNQVDVMLLQLIHRLPDIDGWQGDWPRPLRTFITSVRT